MGTASRIATNEKITARRLDTGATSLLFLRCSRLAPATKPDFRPAQTGDAAAREALLACRAGARPPSQQVNRGKVALRGRELFVHDRPRPRDFQPIRAERHEDSRALE